MNEEISRIDINNVNYKLKDEETRVLGEMGKQALIKVGYYVCSTQGSTAAKTISATDYTLSTGGSIKIKMTNANTADNATLNINSTGAKPLYYDDQRASATNSWDANEVVEIYYDGTSYYANNINGGSGSGVYDVSKEHPTSGPNSDGKFTLEYILNSSNVNELIPVNKRYPGMSIQFVSSSDNKYVQYRLMSDTFNTTPANWQGVDDEPTAGSDNLVKSGGVAADLGSYVSNPEWARVVTDSDGRLLWGIRPDGSIEWAKGIPAPIREALAEKVSSEDLTEVLTEALAGKVDKETGKCLVNEELATASEFIDNVEFAQVLTDSDGRVISSIDRNGNTVLNGTLKAKKVEATGVKSIDDLNPEIEDRLTQLILGKSDGFAYLANRSLTLLHFSDIHGNADNMRRIADLYRKYSARIDDVICTGDWVKALYEDFINPDTVGMGKTLQVIGNHDCWTDQNYDDSPGPIPGQSGLYYVSSERLYDTFFADRKDAQGIVITPDSCFYYKDYVNQKVRLIVLDEYHYAEEQAVWLEGVLFDARTNGMSVICAKHTKAGTHTRMNCTFCSLTDQGSDTALSVYAQKVKDFIDDGGEFVCWLTGHYHCDNVGYLAGDTRQIDINIDFAATDGRTADSLSVLGTRSQDCMNIMSVDTYGKTIKIMRVGRNYDRWMQYKGVLCVNYADGSVVYNN